MRKGPHLKFCLHGHTTSPTSLNSSHYNGGAEFFFFSTFGTWATARERRATSHFRSWKRTAAPAGGPDESQPDVDPAVAPAGGAVGPQPDVGLRGPSDLAGSGLAPRSS